MVLATAAAIRSSVMSNACDACAPINKRKKQLTNSLPFSRFCSAPLNNRSRKLLCEIALLVITEMTATTHGSQRLDIRWNHFVDKILGVWASGIGWYCSYLWLRPFNRNFFTFKCRKSTACIVMSSPTFVWLHRTMATVDSGYRAAYGKVCFYSGTLVDDDDDNEETYKVNNSAHQNLQH